MPDAVSESTSFSRKVALGFAALGLSVLAVAAISVMSLVVTVRNKDAVAATHARRVVHVEELRLLTEKKVAVGRAHLLTGEPRFHDDLVEVDRRLRADIEELRRHADPAARM